MNFSEEEIARMRQEAVEYRDTALYVYRKRSF